jgi:hypothetical protein
MNSKFTEQIKISYKINFECKSSSKMNSFHISRRTRGEVFLQQLEALSKTVALQSQKSWFKLRIIQHLGNNNRKC